MTSTLRAWLEGRTPEELGEILRNRVEATRPVPPRSLSELTERLHYPPGLRATLDVMPRPAIEVVETMLVYGSGGLSRDDLAAVLRVDPDDSGLTAVLVVAGQWALIWEHDGKLYLPGSLRTILPVPLGLGPSAEPMLAQNTADELRALAELLGLARRTRKSDTLADLRQFYADGDAIRALVTQAPSAQQKLLEQLAWHGPSLPRDTAFLYSRKPDPAVAWLIEHGLIVADWQQVVVPREVGVAMRGPDWHPRLDAAAPEIATVSAPPDAVERDVAAAANAAIEQLVGVVEACAVTPLAQLKTGGVGVREIRRLAKTLALTEPTVRLWLEIAFAAGLLAIDDRDDVVVPTDAYDDWTALPPPQRLVTIASTWLDLRRVPLLGTRPDGSAVPAALYHDAYGTIAAELRHEVIRAARRLPPGQGVAGPAALIPMVAWARPIIESYLQGAGPAVEALWAEAHALGFAGRGALSGLARAALDGRDLVEAASAYVHDVTREAIFQADLTAVVPGTPARDVAELLDAAADRESRGAAGTWRFSAASVRRALDGGRSGDGLVAALRGIAVGHALPQPLEYLIADAGRRHGRIRVRAVGAIVSSEDPALLAELVASRALAQLHLVAVAPTVLASALAPEPTLAALRGAGYAPAGENADGSPLIELRPARRTRSAVASGGGFDIIDLFQEAIQLGVPADEALRQVNAVREAVGDGLDLRVAALDVTDLARQLLAAGPDQTVVPAGRGVPTQRAGRKNLVLAEVQRLAQQLRPGEQQSLAGAIEDGTPIRIVYEAQDGERTRRVIEPIELDGKRLVAYCHLREDERHFTVSQILSVRPA